MVIVMVEDGGPPTNESLIEMALRWYLAANAECDAWLDEGARSSTSLASQDGWNDDSSAPLILSATDI